MKKANKGRNRTDTEVASGSRPSNYKALYIQACGLLFYFPKNDMRPIAEHPNGTDREKGLPLDASARQSAAAV